MSRNPDSLRLWWGRGLHPALKQMVVLLDEAGGSVERTVIRGRSQLVDDRDAAQVDYLKRHPQGDPSTRVRRRTKKRSANT